MHPWCDQLLTHPALGQLALVPVSAAQQHHATCAFPCSRYGCQWDTSCYSTGSSNSQRACAPILQAFGLAAAAIWRWDPTVPIFINGLGQDYSSRWRQCGHSFPGMHWGDGFITNAAAVQQYSISNPSRLLKAVEEVGVLRCKLGLFSANKA